ncbi:MAG: hypothetical protein LWW90_09835 [Candidatus Desulfofervidus auxilii]|nr:hypothetical protein [Candidatus Desulfofervidus auxilii]
MLFPKGDDIWVNLRTSFIDVDRLLIFLKKEGFTGYVHFIFLNRESLVFFQEGDVINGIEEIEEERKSGPGTVKEILEQARREKNGKITVSKLSLDLVLTLSEIFYFPVKLVYKGLSSEFSHLGLFIAKLKDEAFTGYIEVHFPDKKQGIISLDKGKIKAIITQESRFRVKKERQTHLKLANLKIVEEAQRKGAIFDVFSAY